MTRILTRVRKVCPRCRRIQSCIRVETCEWTRVICRKCKKWWEETGSDG